MSKLNQMNRSKTSRLYIVISAVLYSTQRSCRLLVKIGYKLAFALREYVEELQSGKQETVCLYYQRKNVSIFVSNLCLRRQLSLRTGGFVGGDFFRISSRTDAISRFRYDKIGFNEEDAEILCFPWVVTLKTIKLWELQIWTRCLFSILLARFPE